jgi:hypothetical protein
MVDFKIIAIGTWDWLKILIKILEDPSGSLILCISYAAAWLTN